jgi:hypothetical protein
MSQLQLSQRDVLSRLLDPVGRIMPREFARDLAELKAAPEVQSRIEELAGKCTEGELTPEERDEYDAYIKAIDVISLLQAKARGVLAGRSDG